MLTELCETLARHLDGLPVFVTDLEAGPCAFMIHLAAVPRATMQALIADLETRFGQVERLTWRVRRGRCDADLGINRPEVPRQLPLF